MSTAKVTHTRKYSISPVNPAWVYVPGVLKPIKCPNASVARLIAAAPELLEALRVIQTMSEGTCSELVAGIHRIATEALSKHEGE